MIHRVVFLLVLGSMSFGTYGADIFKWVDENGQTHYGESVPDPYKRKATKVGRKEEPTDTQRKEAAARLARDKASAESMAARRAKSNEPHSESQPLPVAAESGNKESKCEAEKRKYMESQACFAPYRNATGGIKAEAFQHCVEVLQPKC